MVNLVTGKTKSHCSFSLILFLVASLNTDYLKIHGLHVREKHDINTQTSKKPDTHIYINTNLYITQGGANVGLPLFIWKITQ